MADRFDVIVVGARCAGSPLAALSARAGLKVAVVERAAFPKDTLSTHIFQAPAINFLKRLEVFDRLLETGARTSAELEPPAGGLQVHIRCRPAARRRRCVHVGATVRARSDPS